MEYTIYTVTHGDILNQVFNIYFSNKNCRVKSFASIAEARKFVSGQPDIWIVDMSIMGSDEYGFIKEIKIENIKTPVIFISTQETKFDRVAVLEMGCDDYLEYPFLHRELIIRTHNLLERTYDRNPTPNRSTIKLQNYYIDVDRRVVIHNNNTINLTSKQFDLLLVLAKNQGMALSREQMLNSVWGANYYANDRIVDDMIRRIRNRLIDIKIETIYGFGYRVVK